jgi:hypothetical protein
LIIDLRIAGSAFGMIFLGVVADYTPIYISVPLGTGIAGLACLLLWGFSSGLALLIVFAIVFGFFGVG